MKKKKRKISIEEKSERKTYEDRKNSEKDIKYNENINERMSKKKESRK